MKQIPATISKTPATCFSLNGFFLRMLSVMKVTATVRALAVIELNCQGYLPKRKPQKTEPTLLRARKSKNFHLFKIFHKLLRLKSVGSNYFSSVCVYFSMKGLVPPQKRLTKKNGKMSQRVSYSSIDLNSVKLNLIYVNRFTNNKITHTSLSLYPSLTMSSRIQPPIIFLRKKIGFLAQNTFCIYLTQLFISLSKQMFCRLQVLKSLDSQSPQIYIYKRANTLYNNMKLYYFLLILLFFLVQTRKRPMGMGTTPRARRARAFSSIGRGIASFLKGDIEDTQQDITKGKDMQVELNKVKLHEEMLDNRGSFWTIIIVSIVGTLGILLFLRCRSREENVDIDYTRILQKREERRRRNQVLDALQEHGVHPDRANGNLYRIRL